MVDDPGKGVSVFFKFCCGHATVKERHQREVPFIASLIATLSLELPQIAEHQFELLS